MVSAPGSSRALSLVSANSNQPLSQPPSPHTGPARAHRTAGAPRRIASLRASCRSDRNAPARAEALMLCTHCAMAGTAQPRTMAMMVSTTASSTRVTPRSDALVLMPDSFPEDHPAPASPARPAIRPLHGGLRPGVTDAERSTGISGLRPLRARLHPIALPVLDGGTGDEIARDAGAGALGHGHRGRAGE